MCTEGAGRPGAGCFTRRSRTSASMVLFRGIIWCLRLKKKAKAPVWLSGDIQTSTCASVQGAGLKGPRAHGSACVPSACLGQTQTVTNSIKAPRDFKLTQVKNLNTVTAFYFYRFQLGYFTSEETPGERPRALRSGSPPSCRELKYLFPRFRHPRPDLQTRHHVHEENEELFCPHLL